MLRDVNLRERVAAPLVGRLRHLLGAEDAGKRPDVRADLAGGASWFIYGAYRAAGTQKPEQAGPS